jgi:hypothetical protein
MHEFRKRSNVLDGHLGQLTDLLINQEGQLCSCDKTIKF